MPYQFVKTACEITFQRVVKPTGFLPWKIPFHLRYSNDVVTILDFARQRRLRLKPQDSDLLRILLPFETVFFFWFVSSFLVSIGASKKVSQKSLEKVKEGRG